MLISMDGLIEQVASVKVWSDVSFPVVGERLPLDYPYPLFRAICLVIPAFHDMPSNRIGPIKGLWQKWRGCLSVTPVSRLQLRIPVSEVPNVLALTDVRLELGGGEHVRLGAPTVYPIVASQCLYARAVYIKLGDGRVPTRPTFQAAAQRQISDRMESGTVSIPGVDLRNGNDPSRRILFVRGSHIVGYAVEVSGLSDQDSTRLQTEGLGGRAHFGGGFFIPTTERR